MRKSLSCTRDLLLAFPRSRRSSILPIPSSPFSESRCRCHAAIAQSADTHSRPRHVSRLYILPDRSASPVTQATPPDDDAERTVLKAQADDTFTGIVSLREDSGATPRCSPSVPRPRHIDQHSHDTVPSESTENSILNASTRRLEPIEAVEQDNEQDVVPEICDLEDSRIVAESQGTARRPIGHLLRRHPQIKQALREHRFRWAILEILRHPELRKKEALLSQVRKATWEHAHGGRSFGGAFARLKSQAGTRRTLKDFGLTDLSARLGMPPAGYQRGPHWEQVHRAEVWERGRLPSEKEILKALELDIDLGLMPRVIPFLRAPQLPSQNDQAPPFNRERERQEINRKLSSFVRSGALSRGGLSVASSNSRPKGLARPSQSRAKPGHMQVSRLFAMIDQYRQRGFKPDRVTANIAVKCWLRSLQARQVDGSRIKDSGSYNRQDAERILSHVINDDAFERYIGRPNAVDDTKNWNHALATSRSGPTDRSPLLFDEHVKPLGKLLIKTSRARGDWQAARRILRWLAIFKARCQAEDADQQ